MNANPRELPQEALPHPLEAFTATTPNGFPMSYPGFGWEGYCIDRCISGDWPDAMKWCHDFGLINHDTRTVYNWTLRRLCEQRAPKCAKVLAKLDYPA